MAARQPRPAIARRESSGITAESQAPARLADAAGPRRWRQSKQRWRGETAEQSGCLGPSASKLAGFLQLQQGLQCLNGKWSGGGLRLRNFGMAAALIRELACQQNTPDLAGSIHHNQQQAAVQQETCKGRIQLKSKGARVGKSRTT